VPAPEHRSAPALARSPELAPTAAATAPAARTPGRARSGAVAPAATSLRAIDEAPGGPAPGPVRRGGAPRARIEPAEPRAASSPAPAAPVPDPMRELAESVQAPWAPWVDQSSARAPRRWPSLAELSGPLRWVALLLLAPVFVMLYLGVQRCYGDPVPDSAVAPSQAPPGRVPLADSRSVLENPGRPLWELAQEDAAEPAVQLLVTTPIGQAVRRIVAVEAEALAGGGTKVVLEGDGSFGPVSTVHLRLDEDAPREVIKISGIVEPPAETERPVETAEVERLRFGYHLRRQYNELQVVADLTGPQVRLVRITVEPRRLVLLFERRPRG
jgi:hypothetical protein